MSEANLWHDQYVQTAEELHALRTHLLEEVHQRDMTIIQLENQRLTLLSRLRYAADLLKSQSPIIAREMLCLHQQLKAGYVRKVSTVQSLHSTEGEIQPDVGPAGEAGYTSRADNTSLIPNAGVSQVDGFGTAEVRT